MKKQIKHLIIILAIVTAISILGKFILGALITKIIFWLFIIIGGIIALLLRCKLSIIIILLAWPTQATAQT